MFNNNIYPGWIESSTTHGEFIIFCLETIPFCVRAWLMCMPLLPSPAKRWTYNRLPQTLPWINFYFNSGYNSNSLSLHTLQQYEQSELFQQQAVPKLSCSDIQVIYNLCTPVKCMPLLFLANATLNEETAYKRGGTRHRQQYMNMHKNLLNALYVHIMK